MGDKCHWCSLMCAICRIGCYRCGQKICCKEPSGPRPEFSVIAIGLSQVGKSLLLAKLSAESVEELKPTVGFSVKVIQLPNAILNIKELGGSDNVRKYWSHYYEGSQGIVFVIDSCSSDDDVDLAASELQAALSHPSLESLPLLMLANKQDQEGSRKTEEISQLMGLGVIARNRNWHLQPCSKDDLESVRQGLGKLVTWMEHHEELEQNRV